MDSLLRSYYERFLALPETLRLLAVVTLIGISSLYLLGLVSVLAAPRLRQVPAAYAAAQTVERPTPQADAVYTAPGGAGYTAPGSGTPPTAATATETPTTSPTTRPTLTPTVTATLEATPLQERPRWIQLGGSTATPTARPPRSSPQPEGARPGGSATTSPTPRSSATKPLGAPARPARPDMTGPAPGPSRTPTPRRG